MPLCLQIRVFSSALALAACAAVVCPARAQQTSTATSRALPHKDPTVATVLGVLLPGAGQLYATRYGKAAAVFGGTAAAVAIAIDAGNNKCSTGGTCHQKSLQTAGIITAALIWGYGWATAAGDARLHNSQMLNTSLTPILDRSDGRLLAGLRLVTP